MQISPISCSYNTNFDAKGTATLQSGQTVSVEVRNNARNQIEKIAMNLHHGDNMTQQYERTWFSGGIGYTTIIQSDFLNTFFEKLGVTDDLDKQKIRNLFNATYDSEKSVVNRTAGIPEKPAGPITLQDLHHTEYRAN